MFSALSRVFSDNRKLLLSVAVFAFAFITYSGSLSNGFVWDDHSVIVGNKIFSDPGGLSDLLLSEDTLGKETTGFYRPFSFLSFYMDRIIWGLNPMGYHLSNLLLHAFASVMFFHLALLLFKSYEAAFIAAILFSLNPLNIETVNFLSGGRNTLLSALFAFGSYYMYANNRRFASVLLFCLSITSKEFGLMLPFAFFLHDRLLSPQKFSLRKYLPYLIAASVFIFLRSIVMQGAGIPPYDISLSGRLMLVPETVVRYLKYFVLPFPKFPRVTIPYESFDLRAIAYTSAFMALLLSLYLLRRSRFILFSSLWVLLFLVPVSNIYPLSNSSFFMSDRHAYFSLAGFAILLSYLLSKLKNPLKWAVVSVLLVAYVPMGLSRTRIWHDDLSFYSSMLDNAPGASIGYTNMGMYYMKQGNILKAREYLEIAVNTRGPIKLSYLSLGIIYWETGEIEKSLDLFNKLAKHDIDDFMAYYVLSRLYEEKNDSEASSLYRRKALALEPGAEEIIRQKALSYCISAERLQSEGRAEEAHMFYKSSLLYNPYLARAMIGLGGILAEKGNIDQAMTYFEKAADLEPRNPIPHYNMSLAYEIKGMTRRAKHEMEVFENLRAESIRNGRWGAGRP